MESYTRHRGAERLILVNDHPLSLPKALCATLVLALTAHTALGLDDRDGVYTYVPTTAYCDK
jgi:hypothetical protein